MPRLTKILLLSLILAITIIYPISADNSTLAIVDNPPEYYYNGINLSPINITGYYYTPVDAAMFSKMQELIDQLEKQNQLLTEQNALLANQTLTGRKLVCTNTRVGECWEWTVT